MDQKVEEAMIGKMILKFHNSQISKPIQAVGSHFKHVGSTLFRSIIIWIWMNQKVEEIIMEKIYLVGKQ